MPTDHCDETDDKQAATDLALERLVAHCNLLFPAGALFKALIIVAVPGSYKRPGYAEPYPGLEKRCVGSAVVASILRGNAFARVCIERC